MNVNEPLPSDFQRAIAKALAEGLSALVLPAVLPVTAPPFRERVKIRFEVDKMAAKTALSTRKASEWLSPPPLKRRWLRFKP